MFPNYHQICSSLNFSFKNNVKMYDASIMCSNLLIVWSLMVFISFSHSAFLFWYGVDVLLKYIISTQHVVFIWAIVIAWTLSPIIMRKCVLVLVRQHFDSDISPLKPICHNCWNLAGLFLASSSSKVVQRIQFHTEL